MSPYTHGEPLEKKLIYLQMGEMEEFFVYFSEMYKVEAEVVLSCYCAMSKLLGTILG